MPDAAAVAVLNKIDRIISDLLSELIDERPSSTDQETWADAVESAMNDAWDKLLRAGPDA